MKFNRDAATAMLAAIPEDEPIFVLRAQDKAASRAIRAWIDAAASLGADKDKVAGVRCTLFAFVEWQTANPTRVKVPD